MSQPVPQRGSAQSVLRAPVRLGVVGLGDHLLRAHVAHLAPEGVVVAAADPSPEARRSFAGRARAAGVGRADPLAADLRLVATLDEPWEEPRVEAILVGSPDRFHLEALEAAVGRGVAALVEKPLAADGDQLGRLDAALERAARRGVVVSTCHPRRFDRPYLWLRGALPGLIGRLGEVVEVGLDFSYPAPTKHGLHTGLLADHLGHEIDTLNFLLGPAPLRAHRLADGEDRYAVAGVRGDGVGFGFTGTRRLARGGCREWVRVRLDRGEVVVDTHRGEARIREHEGEGEEVVRIGETDYAGRFGRVQENFLAAVQGVERCYIGHDEMRLNSHLAVELTEGERATWPAGGD